MMKDGVVEKYLPNLAATFAAAKDFAAQIHPGQTVYLEGELGAGKTSFAQGLLKAWNYAGLVTSPTYTLVEPYSFPTFTVFHFDFYRLQDPKELEYIGIKDYFSSTHICLIEWPERAKGYVPKADWIITLEYDQEGRRLRIEKCS